MNGHFRSDVAVDDDISKAATHGSSFWSSGAAVLRLSGTESHQCRTALADTALPGDRSTWTGLGFEDANASCLVP